MMHYCFRSLMFKAFEERLREELKGGIEPVRRAVAQLLSVMLRWCHSSLTRIDIFNFMSKTLATSKASANKKTFMDFCVHFVPICSSKTSKEHFLKPLLMLRMDKAATVRLKYVNDVVPVINKYISVLNASLALELVQHVGQAKMDRD